MTTCPYTFFSQVDAHREKEYTTHMTRHDVPPSLVCLTHAMSQLDSDRYRESVVRQWCSKQRGRIPIAWVIEMVKKMDSDMYRVSIVRILIQYGVDTDKSGIKKLIQGMNSDSHRVTILLHFLATSYRVQSYMDVREILNIMDSDRYRVDILYHLLTAPPVDGSHPHYSETEIRSILSVFDSDTYRLQALSILTKKREDEKKSHPSSIASPHPPPPPPSFRPPIPSSPATMLSPTTTHPPPPSFRLSTHSPTTTALSATTTHSPPLPFWYYKLLAEPFSHVSMPSSASTVTNSTTFHCSCTTSHRSCCCSTYITRFSYFFSSSSSASLCFGSCGCFSSPFGDNCYRSTFCDCLFV